MSELSAQVSSNLENSIAGLLTEKISLPDSGSARDRVGGAIGRVYVEVYTRDGTGRANDPRFRKETNRRILLHNVARDETAQIAIYPDGSLEFLTEPKDPTWVKALFPSLEVPTRAKE